MDCGVENTAVCDAMVAVRGEERGSFIAGSSTRNQRIERLCLVTLQKGTRKPSQPLKFLFVDCHSLQYGVIVLNVLYTIILIT